MKLLGMAAAFLAFGVFVETAAVVVAQGSARTIEIHAKRFSFSPGEITRKKGETVKLVITSDDVTHSLVIPDLHVNALTTKGHPAEVTLTPDKVGDFAGKCGHFCGNGHGTMKFIAHVKDNK